MDSDERFRHGNWHCFYSYRAAREHGTAFTCRFPNDKPCAPYCPRRYRYPCTSDQYDHTHHYPHGDGAGEYDQSVLGENRVGSTERPPK